MFKNRSFSATKFLMILGLAPRFQGRVFSYFGGLGSVWLRVGFGLAWLGFALGWAKILSGILVKLTASTRGIIFPTFPNMVWQGIVLGSILEKASPRQKLNRNLREIDGPDKGHHFSNFSQHGLARGCLGEHFGKSQAKRNTLSGICEFVMVLARIIIFPTFPNMVWEGTVLGTILEKVKPKEKPYQEYVDL